MNRQQLRQTAKQKYTPEMLKKLLDEQQLLVTRRNVSSYSVALSMVLWDKVGKDKEAIKKIVDEVQQLFDSINKNYVSIEDCKRTLSEEADIIFE